MNCNVEPNSHADKNIMVHQLNQAGPKSRSEKQNKESKRNVNVY